MDKQILEMTPEEFDAYIERKNIERQNQQGDESRQPLFYRVMKDDDFFSIRAEKAEKTILLHGQMVGSQLQLSVPAAESGEDVTVNDNEILLKNLNLRLVIDLDDPEALF